VEAICSKRTLAVFNSSKAKFLRRFLSISSIATVLAVTVMLKPTKSVEAFFPTNFKTGFGAFGHSHEQITLDGVKGLYNEFFGTNKQTKSMKDAAKEIAQANSDVDNDQQHAVPHFDGEALPESQSRIFGLFDACVGDLQSGSIGDARKALGQALHTLQDFYAHSNWIEIAGGPNASLIPPGSPLSRLGPNVPTCIFCLPNVVDPFAPICIGNIVTGQLTSGYYHGEVDRVRPNLLKCNHGGITDLDAIPPEGGINKDSRLADFSPHFYLHDTAWPAAQASTQDFIRAIKAKVTNRQIKALLGVGPTLSIVMDTTGSMGDIIASVQAQAIQIVNSRLNSDQEPVEYVLSPFNDPFTGPVTTTEDPNQFIAAINGLTAGGGGDCPELSMSGMLNAESASDEGGDLFMFTDADSKDAGLAGNVSGLAETKDIKLYPCVFGSCSFFAAARASGSLAPASLNSVDPVYNQVASDSGGQLFALQRNEAGAITQLANSVVQSNAVDILSVADTLTGSPKTYTVPVDSTTSQVTFSVSGTTAVTLTRPDGTSVQPSDTGVTLLSLSSAAIYTIASPPSGIWSLSVNGSDGFSASVFGISPLDVSSFSFVETRGRPGHDGEFPIDGFPLAGQAGIVAAKITTDQVSSFQFELRTKQGASLQIAAATPVSTDSPDEIFAQTTVPTTPFVVYTTGLDLNGVPYQRVVPATFRPQTVKVTGPFAEDLNPGSTISYVFQVQNFGPADQFTINTTDNKGFLAGTSPTLVSLATNATASVTVQVRVPAAAAIGTLDTITLTANSITNAAVNNFAVAEGLVFSSSQPPDCSKAQPSVASLWPPNHKMVQVSITGVSDPANDPIMITITSIMQDEATNGSGSGDTCPDATGIGTPIAQLRAERDGSGNGRVYTIFFTADNGKGGTCTGSVKVSVPHNNGGTAVDDGPKFDSTQCPTGSSLRAGHSR
jgi:hypothetical protein